MNSLPALLATGLLLAAGSLASCAFFPSALPPELPPLADLEEPLPLFEEPDDEALRLALTLGGFTGVQVEDARQTLDAMLGEPEGLAVARIVENSPAAAAGLEVGDLLLEADLAGELISLGWTSQWRELELSASEGDRILLVFDRAGVEFEAVLVVQDRVAPPDRVETQRYREQERVGFVVRTATEVEARRAGLGPGGGAVVVGLARSSPWRAAGLQYGDLIVSIDGARVAHPQALLDAVRAAPSGAKAKLEVLRGGKSASQTLTIKAPLTRRKSNTREISIPLIYYYGNDGEQREWSALIGLFQYKSTEAAWRTRLLWLIRFGGGDTDQLVEVDVE